MKKLILLFGLSAAMFACGGAQEEAKPEENNNADTATEAMVENVDNGMYGEPITEEGAMTPADFIAAMEGKDSMQVKIASTIQSSCKKKGCWMKLDMGEGNAEMRVRFKDYGFFIPLESAGKTTVVEGVAFRDTTSVDDLRHYAEDAGKSEEEIAAITEPEVNLAFMANGVIVK